MHAFDSVIEYLEALRGSPALAVLSMQMAADALDISRAAVEQRVRVGSLDGLSIGKTRWVLASSVMSRIDAEQADVYRVRRYLERMATAGEVIEYGTIMGEFGMSSQIPADRKRIGRLLGKVSRETWAERGVLLSVLVVRKGSHNPGEGFFGLAEELDDSYQTATTDAAYLSDQTEAVFSSYGYF